MLHFQCPEALWLLSLVAVPLVIHLVNLRRHKVIYFSDTQFLKQVERQTRRTRETRQLLLLLSRMLALAFLALAFAVPRRGAESAAAKASGAVTVFVDNSLSMQADNAQGSLFAQAKRRAVELLSRIDPTSRVTVVSHGGVAASGLAPGFAAAAVDGIGLWPATLHPKALASLLAREATGGGADTAAVWIFSDFQANYWAAFRGLADTALRPACFAFRPDPPANVGVDTAWFDTPYHNPGVEQVLSARVRNHGPRFRSNVPVRLLVNDTLVSARSVDLEGGESKTVEFRYALPNRGWVSGRVSVDDFPVEFDNDWHFCYRVADRARALLVGDAAFFGRVSTLYEVSGQISSAVVAPGSLSPSAVDSAACVVVRDLSSLAAPTLDMLLRRVEGGATLALFADRPSAGEGEALSRVGLGRPGPPRRAGGVASGVDLRHFLFRGAVASVDAGTRMPAVDTVRPLQVSAPWRAVLSDDMGNALLAARGYGRGNVFVFAAPLAADGDFSSSPLFVPLFVNMARFAGRASAPVFTLGYGQCVDMPAADIPAGAAPRLVPPGGDDAQAFIPRFERLGGEVRLCLENRVGSAGVWRVDAGGGAAALAAFNYGRAESRAEYLADTDIAPAGPTVAGAADIDGAPFAWWRVAAALALAFMLCEMLLWRR